MKRSELTPLQTWSILCGAALMLSLAMGMRQSLGLFQPQMIRDIGIDAAQFSFAIAIQNIVWGLTQPFAGMLADRWGTKPVALAGVVVYAAGLGLAIVAQSPWLLTLGFGICIGLALSCTASSIVMSITSRTVTPARRSVAMGAVSAVGSIGLVLAAPLAQSLLSSHGWKVAMLAFVVLAIAMLPAAWSAGAADRIE